MISIVLAASHHVVRQSLYTLLDAESDLQVVGEASDGLETTQLVESLHPAVLVTYLQMGVMNGIDVTREVNNCSPGTKVVILSMHSYEAYVFEAFQAGARAYVLTESIGTDLVPAIRKVVVGKIYLSPPLSQQTIEAYSERINTTNYA